MQSIDTYLLPAVRITQALDYNLIRGRGRRDRLFGGAEFDPPRKRIAIGARCASWGALILARRIQEMGADADVKLSPRFRVNGTRSGQKWHSVYKQKVIEIMKFIMIKNNYVMLHFI